MQRCLVASSMILSAISLGQFAQQANAQVVQGGGLWDVAVRVPDTGTPVGFQIESLTEAETLMDAASGFIEFTDSPSIIDYKAGGVTPGHFPSDVPFPGTPAGDFATRVTGLIDVISPGDITFGGTFNFAGLMRIDGTTVFESGATNGDLLGTINLTEGLHSVEVLHYEEDGSETLELWVATSNGTFTTFSADNFELLPAGAQAAAVPEPASWICFFVVGMAVFGYAVRRRQTRK